MTQPRDLFSSLRRLADPQIVDALDRLVSRGGDGELARMNPVKFAADHGFNADLTIDAFLHGTRIGLFELFWNVVCPGCSGVLSAGGSLKTVDRDNYRCSLCAADCEPLLDETVEVAFAISPRVRRIAAHEPDSLPVWDYARLIYWSSGIDIPEDLDPVIREASLGSIDLAAHEHVVRTIDLPQGTIVVFDPVTHSSQFLEIGGAPVDRPSELTVVFGQHHKERPVAHMRPGPLRLSLENGTDRRILPIIWIAGEALRSLVGRRIPYLTAKRLLTNQTFRNIYRTDVLDINQRLKIMSLTFLFTDLKSSTELYERIGDLAAYDLVRLHFQALEGIIAEEAGAVVKTIGDAVMATFASPDRGMAAALRMRKAMESLNAGRGRGDILLKIGIHEGPCLAVTLNDRQDYFGQTVNIASRVQNLADSQAIFATGAVAEYPEARELIEAQGRSMTQRLATLRGIQQKISIYEIG